MENKLRRGLALLMTLIMLISCAPMDALAAIVPVSGGTQTSSGVSLKSIVKPPVATTTYVFMNGTEEFARQILKNGETLNNPGTPEADSANKEFVGWYDGNTQLSFPYTVSVGNASSTVTVKAKFADVYFVFFTNEKGEVMVTKKGKKDDTISTEGVTYPVGNEQSIIGWNYTGNENDPLISAVKLEDKDVKLKAVVKDGHWITFDSQGGTYVEPAFVKGNETTTAPAAPTRPGYTFDHWSATVGGAAFTFGQPLDQALTLYAVWTANTNTRYTVIHWQENADDDEYSYAESETKYGTTGAQTSAAAKSYTGFTVQTIAQQTIAGDGSTIVSVYYKRNVYNVQFYNRRGNSEYTQYKITAKYGANIRDKWPTHEESSSWYVATSGRTAQVGIDTMPLNGAKFYGPQTGYGTSTAYYYVQVLPGESGETVSGVTYKLHHKDTSPGGNYSVSVEDQYPITGFTFNSSPSTSIGQNYNNAKFYYTRNSYDIVYMSGGEKVNTVSKKFEESIADEGGYTPTTKPAGMEDYDFGGWHADETTTKPYDFTGKTMPAQNVTVYAKWNKPVYNGTIYLTIEGTTGSSITLNVPKGDTIETALNEKKAEIMAQVGEGFTRRGWRTGKDGTGEPFNPQTQITTDVTLYPYYTKDGTFTVEYVTGKDDVTAPEDGKSYAEDSFADLMSPGKLVAADGEYFLGWSDGAATYQPRDKYQIKSNHANERNVITLTAKWGARPAGTTLTYNANGGTGADVVENLANNATVTTIANPFSRVGYTFKGWDTDPKGEGSIAPNTQVQVDNGNGENVLYAIWTANADTKYTVEFYYQNVGGTYTLNHSDERTATTDTEVSVTDADKAAKENNKYVFEADNKNNVLSGNVAGDGSLVLKLYFKLNTASYTIHHYLNGTTVKVADDETGTKTIGEELTAKKSGALYPAYAAAEVADYAPSQKITINATGNVITVYYTVPLTITAGSAEKTYNGQPLTQPDFKMEGLVNGDTKDKFSLSMTASSTITNAGNTPNVIDKDTVKYNGGAIPSYYNVSYEPGTLTVKKASATVTITGVNKTHVYDGTQHEANGYNYSFTGKPNEITISPKPNVVAIARRTDVGTTYMGLTKDSFTVTSANYDVTIKAVIDGYVTITPVTDKVTVTVTENGAIVTYDGNEHSVKGYKSMTADNKLYDVSKSVKTTETAAWTATGTDAGEYPVGVAAGDFENINKNFTNVAFKIVDDVLKINPITAEVIVTVTENGATVTYDGTEHSVKGYKSMTADNTLYDVAASVKATETDAWTAKGTNAGEYPVGIAAGDFENTNKNFTNVTFKIVDGVLKINPITENTITITANSASKTYDGTPLTDALYNYTEGVLVNGDVLTAVVEGSQTDAGSSVNTVTSYKVMRGDKDVTGNYTFGESVMGTLTVSPRPVTITAQDYTVEYDGQPHGKNPTTAYVVAPAAQNSGLVNGHTESNVNIAFTATDAGTYTDKLVIDKTAVTIVDSNNKNVTGNYAIELEPGTLTIEQHKGEVIVTIKGNTQQFTYDCTKHTVQGFTATVNNSLYNVNTDFKYDGNLYEAATLLAVAEGTNVGVYHMNLLSNHCVNLNKNFANVTFRVQDGSLAIERQYLAIEVDNSSKVYGAADPAFADATLRFYNKTGVIIEPSADMKQELSGIDLTVHRADAGDNTIGTHVDVLTISKTAEELNKIYTNYEIGVDKGDFEITSTEESLKVRADNYEGAYDGDGHGVVAKAYINGTVEAPNAVIRYYNEVTGKFDLTESPKFIDVKSATPGERTYTVRFQATLDGLTAEGSANVLIAPRKLVLSSGTESKDYDGLPLTSQEVVIIEGSIIKGQIYDLKATGSVTTVAEGMVKNTITYSTTDEFKPVNYEIEQKPGMLQIEKRDVSLTSETASKEYDGTPLTRENVTVERNGFVAGEVTDLRATGSVTYVDQGEVTNTITFTPTDKFDENNYSITKQEGKLSITKREGEGKTITVTAANDEKVYDGTPLTNNDFTHTGVLVDGDVLTAVVEGSATNVGDEGKNVVKSYRVMRGDVDVTGNYTFGNSIDGKLTINKRTVNLTSETASKEYDGKPLTKPVVTVTGNGFVTGEVSDIKATGSATFVDDGKVTNAITYTEGENFKETNYTISKEEGKLSITKRGGEGKTITVTANSDEKVYDGAPLTNNGFTHAGALVEGDELTAVVEGSQTDVGSSNNVVKSYRVMRGETDVTNNYTFGESIIGTLTVTPVAIELTAASASKAYDGTPLTNSNYTITKGAFVDGEGLATVTIAGSQTLVGASANTITGHTLKDNTLAQNYTITYQPGELKVTQNEKAITITANSHTWEYDGQPHSDGGYTVEYDGQTYKVAAGETATLTTGDVVKATVEGIVTNVADSADDNNVVTNVTIANRAGDTVNDQYKTITRVNGGLKITKRGDSEDEDKKVKIIAEPNTVGYDGSAHGAKLNAKDEIELGTSYTTARLVDGHYVDENTLDITGSQTNVGVYAEELKPAVKAGTTRIVIRDKDGNDVTDNYALMLVNATLTITGDKLIPDKKAEDENIESNYKLGDEIEFTITVKNVSIYDVENVIVTDANAEIQAGDGYTVSADKHTATIAIIAAKSEIRIKALHTVTSEDILAGKVGNVANVGWKDGETTVGDDTTKLTPPDVKLTVTKTSDWEGKATGAKPKLGTKITYTITVKNDGNVPYTNVNFTDLLQNSAATVTGEIPTYGTLAVNEKKSFTVEHIVTEADLLKAAITNKVTAEADEIEYTYYEGDEVKTGKATPKGEDEVTDNTDAASASFTSTKTTTSTPKNEKGYELGETITYEIKVTNDGNLTLTDVEVVDNLEGAEIKAGSGYDVVNGKAVIAELKPGESVTVKVEYVVTEADILAGKVVNDATVTGKGPGTDPEPDEPKTDDPTDEPKATLEIVKAVEGNPENGTSYALGETITYKLTVKVGADNNVTVKDIKVTDTLLTKANVDSGAVEIKGSYTLNDKNKIELPDMAPGAADVVITYTYTVQESDLGSGKYGTVHNTATVQGATPEQKPDNPNPKPDDPTGEDDNDTPTNIRLVITANGYSVEYDGKLHGENGYEQEGLASGHEITGITIGGGQKNVGKYVGEFKPNVTEIKDGERNVVTDHYEITYVPGNLEITQSTKELKVTANNGEWVYDGKQHSDGGYTVNYDGKDYPVKADGSVELPTGDVVKATVEGTVTNVADSADDNNVVTNVTITNKAGTVVNGQYKTITTVNGGLKITRRPVEITVNDNKTFTYDAAEHTVAGDDGKEYTVVLATENSDSGLLSGHTESLNVVYDDGTTKTESRKYVGTYTADSERDENGKAVVTITKEDSGEDVTANYAIVVIPGELEIKKAEALIKIVGPDSERVYNGQKQVVRTTDITTDPDYAPSEEEPDKIKILVTGLIPDDYIEIGTVIHVAEGTYVGKYEGNFEWDGLHKDEMIPTVLNDGIDVTQNYRFEYAKGWLTIKSNQPGEHPTQPDKEIDGHEPGTKYALGDRIYFKITVRNITLEKLELVEVHDPTAVIVPGDGYTVVDEHHAKIENMPASVDGQEPATVIINAYHVVTEDDIKNIVIDSGYKYENVATIKVGDKTIDARKGTNDIEDADYTLKIEKQLINRPASGEKFKLGETAKFQITVTNEGNVTQTDIPVAEKLPGAVFTEGDGYTLNADKTVATITKVLNPADKETQHGDSIILYAQYTITENDLGNAGLKNIVAAPNGNPGEEPIPVDEAKSVSGRKIWNDLENRYNTRTESVTVNLMRKAGQNGAAEQYKTATVDQSTGWRYGFDHLPAHDMQNNEFFYWVEEAPITGYEPTYEVKDDSHCDIVNNLQTYTLTIHYWQHKLGDTKMEQAFPDYVATLYYKQPYDVESPEREGIILDDMSQARISGTMPVHDLVIDVYYHRIAYRLTIHYIYQDGTMAHEDYTWTYWFNSTYNVPSPIIPGFTPSIDVIAGRMPSHGLELTVVYVGDGEIVIPDEDTSLGFKSYLNAGECFE